jgi:uncharacterized protein (DUF58 family)
MIKINKIYILFIISSFIFAYLEGGNLPYAVFYMLIISFFTSLIFVNSISGKIDVRFKSDKNTFTRNQQAEITEIIYNEGYLPMPYIYYLNNSLKNIDNDYKGLLFSLNAEKTRWNNNKVLFNKRGKYNISNISLEFGDFFNIVKYNKNINKDIFVYVYPEVYKISEINSGGKDIYRENFSLDSRNTDIHKFKDIRKYQVGESLKKIHWKVTAKKGELYSKNNDNVSVNDVLLILDMNIKNNYMDASKDVEEELVSYFLSVVNFFIASGIRVRVLINNEKSEDIVLRDSVDFDLLLDYFLENKSKGTKKIINFIKSYSEFYQDDIWAGIFTLDIDNMFINCIKDIWDKINLFYLPEASYLSYIRNAEKASISCYNSKALLIKE